MRGAGGAATSEQTLSESALRPPPTPTPASQTEGGSVLYGNTDHPKGESGLGPHLPPPGAPPPVVRGTARPAGPNQGNQDREAGSRRRDGSTWRPAPTAGSRLPARQECPSPAGLSEGFASSPTAPFPVASAPARQTGCKRPHPVGVWSCLQAHRPLGCLAKGQTPPPAWALSRGPGPPRDPFSRAARRTEGPCPGGGGLPQPGPVPSPSAPCSGPSGSSDGPPPASAWCLSAVPAPLAALDLGMSRMS